MVGMTEKLEKAACRMANSQYNAIYKLRWIRKKNYLTKREVAKRMGASPLTVLRIESGNFDLRLTTIRRYALACGAEISFNVTDQPTV